MAASAVAARQTLRRGMHGPDVQEMQTILIEKGFLTGEADGAFGKETEKAVKAFQKANGLKVDGLAGSRTLDKLYGISWEKQEPAEIKSDDLQGNNNSYFNGDYSVIDKATDNRRVRKLQQALIKLEYLKGEADGEYGTVTRKAVRDFQKAVKLKSDGIPGRLTLQALEQAYQKGEKKNDIKRALEKLPEETGRTNAPDKSSIELLYWFDDIKPRLRNGNRLRVYDPASSTAWDLQVYGLGRHCNCEPLTAEDTLIMLRAFGGKYTWNQKGVYVLLPDGRWTVGAIHDVPQGTGKIQGNSFDGYLGLHFMRDWDECAEKDPLYGISNQQTIRQLWKSLTGVYVR